MTNRRQAALKSWKTRRVRDAFAKARVPTEIEVYPARHGWCVPDMPAQNGPIYSKPDAERAWGKLVALYKTALA